MDESERRRIEADPLLLKLRSQAGKPDNLDDFRRMLVEEIPRHLEEYWGVTNLCLPVELVQGIDQEDARERYRLAVERYRGFDCVDLRVFYEDDDSGEFKPSRKGLSVRLEKWPEFRAALDDLEGRLELAGLLDGAAAGEGDA